jgi:hypothetical protein
VRARVLLVCISACVVVGAVLALAGGGSAARLGDSAAAATVPPIHYGVADDASKYADDGGAWFYGKLNDARLTENRWTLAWDPSKPTTITELPFLQRAAPKAQDAKVHVVLALYSTQAAQHDPILFCTWAAQVATTVKGWGIHDFIVWNEPNTRLYWTPQDQAGAAYEPLLAQCYDMIHAADSDANVIGMGLSPRASTSASTEPLVFLRDVGKAYRASHRAAPIMDQLAIHPYPNPSNPTDSPDVGYEVTDRYGIPNLDRVKQAVYSAFNGTKQPTTLNGLTFRIDEVGWQTDTTAYPQYVNAENVAVVSEATQVQYLQTMMEKYFACDPTVTDVELFLLVDEKYRNGKDANGVTVGGGWQSGLLTAGGQGVSTAKAAYSDARLTFDRDMGRAACHGSMTTWAPVTKPEVTVDWGPYAGAESAFLLPESVSSIPVTVTSNVPYSWALGGADDTDGYSDSRAKGSRGAGTATLLYPNAPSGPLYLTVTPEGSSTSLYFSSAALYPVSASIIKDWTEYVYLTTGDMRKVMGYGSGQIDAFVALLQNAVSIPFVKCPKGSIECSIRAVLTQIVFPTSARSVASRRAAAGKVYRAAVRVKPGHRGRPVLRLRGLKAGVYSLTLTFKRGARAASLTAYPLKLDRKGRILNNKLKPLKGKTPKRH